jgi:hypothetical protein
MKFLPALHQSFTAGAKEKSAPASTLRRNLALVPAV